MSENLDKERLGEEDYNNFGSLMRIIKYRNNRDIDVYFPEFDWIYYHARYDSFKCKKNKMSI